MQHVSVFLSARKEKEKEKLHMRSVSHDDETQGSEKIQRHRKTVAEDKKRLTRRTSR